MTRSLKPILVAAISLAAAACLVAAASESASPSTATTAATLATATPAPAPQGPAADKKIQIEVKPGSPWLDFIKVESVRPSASGATVMLTGRVTFNEDHTQRVASPVDGRVLAIKVQPGDKVKAGQTLLTLTSPQVAQLQSDFQKAAQDLSVAQKALDRANKLKADGAISEKELAQLEADFAKAKSERGRVEAQLKVLGIGAGQPTVVQAQLASQIAGMVVERAVLVGQEVRADAAQPLITVADLDTVWVMADVYEQDLALARVGAKVKVTVPAYPGETFPGTVSYVGAVVDPTTRTVKLRCQVANPDGKLKPEMFAKVELESENAAQALVVPARAVLNDGERSEVLVAEKGGIFKIRRVEVGPEVDGNVRVLQGLEPQEVVVTDGALFLKQEIQDQ